MNTGENPVMVCFADRFIAQDGAQTRTGKGRRKARRTAIKCLKGLWWLTKWTSIVLVFIALMIITLPLALFAS